MSNKNLHNNPIHDTLPGLTTVYQSKELTKRAFKGFDVMHNRLYLYVLLSFQSEIFKHLTQLEIDFDDNQYNDNILKIKIELNKIAFNRSDFQSAINAAKDLEDIKIQRKTIIDNQEFTYHSRLFDTVYEPVIINKKKCIYVDIKRDLYDDLIKKHFSKDNKLVFTTFYYEVCAHSRNKYLPKLYMLLSDSENRGFLPAISHVELAQILGIDFEVQKSYKQIKNFNARILEPIKKELYDTCKFMFNYTFHKYVGKNEYYYKFVIVNREELLKIDNQFKLIKTLVPPVFYDELIDLIQVKLDENYSSIFLNKLAQMMLKETTYLKNNSIQEPLEYLKNKILTFKVED